VITDKMSEIDGNTYFAFIQKFHILRLTFQSSIKAKINVFPWRIRYEQFCCSLFLENC